MDKENIPIIIDGPNYINRILDMSIDNDIISNQLSFKNFRNVIGTDTHFLSQLIFYF